MISLLDTNVIIRFLLSDKTPKYKFLFSFFQSLEHGELRVELKLIVLFQVVFVLKSYYKIPKLDIADKMIDLLRLKGLVVKEKKNIRRMMELWRDNNLEIVDCYLVACLERDKQNILYSYDRDFDKFGINRREP